MDSIMITDNAIYCVCVAFVLGMLAYSSVSLNRDTDRKEKEKLQSLFELSSMCARNGRVSTIKLQYLTLDELVQWELGQMRGLELKKEDEE